LESDALFDEIEAGAQWPAKRAEIARNKAAERQQQPAGTANPSNAEPVSPAPRKTPAWKKAIQASDSEDKSDDEDALLGEMFSAVPDSAPTASEPSTSDVVLKDFGKQTGVPPRRVLEEALRARYVNKL
jgi:ATP-dependent RNA helicase DHX29